MKKTIFLLTIALTALIFNSCRVAPTDSQLDAQWQLMVVETPDTTITPGNPDIPSNPRVYYSFYRHTATLTTSHGQAINANLEYVEKQSLKLDFAGLTWEDLAPWFIEGDAQQTHPSVTFSVEKIDGKQLVLFDDLTQTQYTFRKY